MASISRRQFLSKALGTTVAGLVTSAGCATTGSPARQERLNKPNILWISAEDISPDLGCYGDDYAVTPNIDRFASGSLRYTNAFTNAGVCAPVRSAIITAMYATTIGTHNMRCKGVPPTPVKCFTEYLRDAGYFCTNNKKTDYQFNSPDTAWDQCDSNAHWRNRRSGQPFFSVFNLTVTHESKIRDHSENFRKKLDFLSADERHDPEKAEIPPYYPDTPKVRKDWAQYHDIITLMDKQFREILDQLETDGLAEDTIVFFWGDHGRGLPRAKRWIYDSGTRVPLIIHIPDKYCRLAMPVDPPAVSGGMVTDRLVSFVDLGPTVLSLAGVLPPDHIQSQAFLGPRQQIRRKYVFAARDRMDEAYDLIRSVRDKRFRYIRNYMWYRTYALDIDYMNEMPTMAEMRRLHRLGKLQGPEKLYFRQTKPLEELYDTKQDPHEINNLANDPTYRATLVSMRKVHEKWMEQTEDVGLIPEPIFDEMKRPGGNYRQTAKPMFQVLPDSKQKQAKLVRIICPTPNSSVAYKLPGYPGNMLYSRPVVLKPGQTLRARAFRLGYEPSEPVEFKLTDTPASDAEIRAAGRQHEHIHWKQQLGRGDLLNRLREIKALDFLGPEAFDSYRQKLDDKYASVRYWAVVGLHHNTSPDQKSRAATAIAPLLNDSSAVVRIAAAEALCDIRSDNQPLDVLTGFLKDERPKIRLWAATSLKSLGSRAAPALGQIKQATNDSYRYVSRLAENTIEDLQQAGDI